MALDKWSDKEYRTTLPNGKRYHIRQKSDGVWRAFAEDDRNRIIATGLTVETTRDLAEQIVLASIPRIIGIVVEGKKMDVSEMFDGDQINIDESEEGHVDSVKVFVTSPHFGDMSMCMHITAGGVQVTTHGAPDDMIDEQILQNWELKQIDQRRMGELIAAHAS